MSRKTAVPAAPSEPKVPASARATPAEVASATPLQPPTRDGVADAEAVRTRAHARSGSRPGGPKATGWNSGCGPSRS